MKKILLTTALTALLYPAASWAQRFDAETVQYQRPQTTAEQPATAAQPAFARTNGNGLFPELRGSEQPAARTSGRGDQQQASQNIILSQDDVEIMTPPVGLAVCFAKMILKNNTPYTIGTIEIQAKFGQITNGISFGGVAPGGEQTQQLAFAGPSCQQMLGTPTISVVSCSGDLTTEQCAGLLKFEPIIKR